MNDLLKEIKSGPVTLVIIVLIVVGGAVICFGDATAVDRYLDLLDRIQIPLAGLAAGRGIAVAGKAGKTPANPDRPIDPPVST